MIRVFSVFICVSFLLTSLNLVMGCSNSKHFAPQSQSQPNERWNDLNDPQVFSAVQERRWTHLPQAASLTTPPWSGYYWPHKGAGIAYRWQNPEIDPFGYLSPLPVLPSGSVLNTQIVKGLSPAEKFDILGQRYGYPLVASERQRTSGDHVSWSGLCHGWAASAVLFDEPKPVTVVNADGVEIPFLSGDIAALLAHYLGVTRSLPSFQAGLRCRSAAGAGARTTPSSTAQPDGGACLEDLNAGAFHIILTNLIGIKRTPFIIDSSPDEAVWNHVVTSYQVLPHAQLGPGTTSAPGTLKRQEVELKVRIVVMASPSRGGLRAQGLNKTRVLSYRYLLELGAQDQILGGEWVSHERPDFAWLPLLPSEAQGNSLQMLKQSAPPWNLLGALYEASLKQWNGRIVRVPTPQPPAPSPTEPPVPRPSPTPIPQPSQPDSQGPVTPNGASWCVETNPGSGYQNACIDFMTRRGHRFQQKALEICLGLNDDLDRFYCYQYVADKVFPSQGLHSCGVIFDPENNVACLKTLPWRRP